MPVGDAAPYLLALGPSQGLEDGVGVRALVVCQPRQDRDVSTREAVGDQEPRESAVRNGSIGAKRCNRR